MGQPREQPHPRAVFGRNHVNTSGGGLARSVDRFEFSNCKCHQVRWQWRRSPKFDTFLIAERNSLRDRHVRNCHKLGWNYQRNLPWNLEAWFVPTWKCPARLLRLHLRKDIPCASRLSSIDRGAVYVQRVCKGALQNVTSFCYLAAAFRGDKVHRSSQQFERDAVQS